MFKVNNVNIPIKFFHHIKRMVAELTFTWSKSPIVTIKKV